MFLMGRVTLLLFLFFFSFFSTTHTWLVSSVIMKDAVRSGDAKKLAELIRQDPGFNVNMDHGNGNTYLQTACREDSSSAVIPLLLAHPDIDVNVKNTIGQTPFTMLVVDSPPVFVRC